MCYGGQETTYYTVTTAALNSSLQRLQSGLKSGIVDPGLKSVGVMGPKSSKKMRARPGT